MARPSFINLWNAYPSVASPCDGPWPNQCAIRMSIALNGEQSIRINKSTYSEPKCAHEHARGAESLANWLSKKQQLSAPKVYTEGTTAREALANRTGIVFFKDFFYQPSDAQGRPTGDHIDLWSRSLAKGHEYFSRAKAVWFWELA